MATGKQRRRKNGRRKNSVPKPKLPAERLEGRPLLSNIVERCVELGIEARALPEGSPKRKAIERRIATLDSYTIPHPYDRSDSPQMQDFLHRFQQLQYQNSTRPSWELSVKETAKYRDRLLKRPKGHPVDFRYRLVEGYERKVAEHLTWERLADEMGVNFENLMRQVEMLRKLLRKEGISIPQ